MKTSANDLLLSAVLVIGANGLMASPASNTWSGEWYRAKFGRSSPLEEARQRAERANTAYREETTSASPSPANDWLEQWHRAKFGRSLTNEDARHKTERR